MSEKTYRVIQWVTGHVGSIGLRHVIANPTYRLVGLLVKSIVGTTEGFIFFSVCSSVRDGIF